MPSSQFTGTWKLLSCEFRRSDGTVTYPYGKEADGLLMYDARGHMAVQLIGADRVANASDDLLGGTPEEAKASLDSIVTYFGTFRVDEEAALVTHHLENSSHPNWKGSEQKRFYVFSDDRLTLTTAPLQVGGNTVIAALVWERVA